MPVKMIRFVIFIFLLLDSSAAISQKIFVSQDSSRLIFPNHVAIDFARKIRSGISAFEFNQPALKTLLVQWNYVYGMLEANQEKARLQEKELVVKDSIIQSLKNQLTITDERLLLYSSGYEEVKAISNKYDIQVNALIAELQMVRKNDRRAKRRFFSKGLLVGLGGGIAITSFLVVLSN